MKIFFWESVYALQRAWSHIVLIHRERAQEDGKTLFPCGAYPNTTTGNEGGPEYQKVSRDIEDIDRTLFIVAWGQSNCAAYSGLREPKYDPLPNNHMMDVHTGSVYRAQDPMVGCNGEYQCYVMRLADKILQQKAFDRVIVTNLAIGSTLISEWASSGGCSHRLDVAALRFRENGWLPKHIAFIGTIGENDNIYATSVQRYTRYGLDVMNKCRRIFGVRDAPFLMTHTSYIMGKTSAPIRAAQAALCTAQNNAYLIADTDIYISDGDRDGADHFSVSTAERVAADCLSPTLAALGFTMS